MKTIYGDLLEGQWDCAFHCANVHKVMGSGVAYFLKQKWPEVYQADVDLDLDYEFPHHKLGLFSRANIEPGRFVYNLYGQQGIGNDGTPLDRNCRYDALYDAMYKACESICILMDDDIKIGIPKHMGCCRAGGSWYVVEGMLKDLEERFPVEFVVYDIQNGEVTAQSTQPALKDIQDIFKLSREVGCDTQIKNK